MGIKIKTSYYIKNKNVDGWYDWKGMIKEYMRISPIRGLKVAIKRIFSEVTK